MSDSNKLVLVAIIGIFVGLVLGRLLWYSRTSLPDELPIAEETSDTPKEGDVSATKGMPIQESNGKETVVVKEGEYNSVSVENQPAGNSAQISVTADQTVWVEVRDNNNGVMGKVLGAKHVDAGTRTVTVGLQRSTVKGGSYFVVLAPYNNGDIDYSVGALLKDASGQPISASFTAE